MSFLGNSHATPIVLSDYFPYSRLLGLFPGASDDKANRNQVLYAAVTHVVYRLANVSLLVYFLLTTPTSKSLLALLATVTILKCLCTTVHVIMVVKRREVLLSMFSQCSKRDFLENKYRTITKLGVFFQCYIYLTATIIQRRPLAAVRDAFSAVDVLTCFFVVAQFCTFVEVTSKQFSRNRWLLVVRFYRAEEITLRHARDMDLARHVQDVFKRQLLVCMLYFGFEFFVASYDALEKVRSQSHTEWLVCTTSYSFFCISTFIMGCHATEMNRRNIAKFNLELFHLLEDNAKLRENHKLRLYIAMNPTIDYTACRFFTLNHRLVRSIISASITYLGIIIQISKAGDQ